MIWTPELVERLIHLRQHEGLSTKATADRLGLTKNTVAGKLKRLGVGLPASVTDSIWTPELVERLIGLRKEGLSTKDAAAALGVTKNSVISKLKRLDERGLLDDDDSPIQTMEDRLSAMPQLPDSRHCVWPYGHVGEPGFSFCGDWAAYGAPYCASHLAVAWVKPKLQRI